MREARGIPPIPGLDEALIQRLVHEFYARVRADAELGPIFERAIRNDWDAHLARMCDFWSSVVLMTGRYKGNPMTVHMRQKQIRPEHFRRWLALFGETAREICSPGVAALFEVKAQNIARSLELGMFYRPG